MAWPIFSVLKLFDHGYSSKKIYNAGSFYAASIDKSEYIEVKNWLSDKISTNQITMDLGAW